MQFESDLDEILFFLAEHWVPVRQMLRTMSRGDSLTAEIFTNCLAREFRVPTRLLPTLRRLLDECCRYHDVVHTETLRKRVDDAKKARLEREFGPDPVDEYFRASPPRHQPPASIPKPPAPSSTMRGTVGSAKAAEYHESMRLFRNSNNDSNNGNNGAVARPCSCPVPAAADQQRSRSNSSARADSNNGGAAAASAAAPAAAGTKSVFAAAAAGAAAAAAARPATAAAAPSSPRGVYSVANNNNNNNNNGAVPLPTAMLASSHRGCTPKVDLSHRREVLRAQFLKATGGIAVVTKGHFREALDAIAPWPVAAGDFAEIYDAVHRPGDGKVHVDDFCHRFCEEYVQRSSSFAASMRPCFAPIGKSPRYRHGAIGEKVTGGPSTSGGGGGGGMNSGAIAGSFGASTAALIGGGIGSGRSASVKASSSARILLPPANPRAAVVARAQREQEERDRQARRVVRLTRASELRKEVGALFRKTVDSYDGYLACGVLPSPRRPSSAHMVSIGSAGVVTGAVHIPDPPLPTKYHRINTRVEPDAELLGNVARGASVSPH